MTTTNHRTGGAVGANGYGEYQVRYASDKQQLFIKTLLDTKEHSLGAVDVMTLNVQGAGDLITQLLSLPNKAGVITPPTPKQLSFATSLIQKKEGGLETLNHYLANRKALAIEQLSRADVSEIINALNYASDKQEPTKLTLKDVGAYLLNEVVYSIREGKQSGRLQVWSYSDVAKKYARDVKNEKEVLSKVELTDRLTLENAIKYSAQTGSCVHCGRTLTVLKSVAGGMGPICAKKYY
ncbi:hypothetical protein UFOVP964_96 [uncultured Caudovirales phage]|uniref:Uncharacterized protein n=1 Tax=uncultured Caudovirales phage TaxID=2100421 RepID=A0A6J5P733_9CAUD|nr:hypothetical protein UFOVP854_96 [uncultured Caudovirales phage]CAB4174884.1 hypothetical protein UFOVP964_96 [uncultured Caudovirales phage]CAB4179303.1 hypothetical protein UFOVP1034_62 [uncultured Caudovirales phage]CAB4189106.1 hypothetical protein UFOVP1177_62 [uncultured Caudovirales phage]CAB4193266.1 hypothetical protein UFOVP1243_49 [uncultured Caudovirales phage]